MRLATSGFETKLTWRTPSGIACSTVNAAPYYGEPIIVSFPCANARSATYSTPALHVTVRMPGTQ
jgi:hypothetical protein